MKLRSCFFLSLGLLLAPTLPAQDPAPAAALAAPAESGPRFTADQLDLLLGPIALYPDALIALILPAATTPSDIVIAARYLKGGDPAQLDDQPWSDSVKSLAHYAAVVAWMDENLPWTKQLGEAFLEQPADVMQAVQRLRAKAKAAGTLVDTPEQQMVVDGDDIDIVPVQPDLIYVPRYDPEVVYYVQQPRNYPNPFLTFGSGYPTGLWLTYDIDWAHRSIWYSRGHDNHRDWRHPGFPGRPGYVADPNRQPWQPPQRPVPRPRPAEPRRPPPVIVRPPPLPGAPPRPPGWHRDPPDQPRPTTRPNNRDPQPTTPAVIPPAPRPSNPDREHDDHRSRMMPVREPQNTPPSPPPERTYSAPRNTPPPQSAPAPTPAPAAQPAPSPAPPPPPPSTPPPQAPSDDKNQNPRSREQQN